MTQNVSGREKARFESDVPFTLSLSERTLFCRFRAKRARLIFHIAASLRLAVLVRTAVMASVIKGENRLSLKQHNVTILTALKMYVCEAKDASVQQEEMSWSHDYYTQRCDTQI